MGYFITALICLIVGFLGGGVVLYFVAKNNPKYFNLAAVIAKLEGMAQADLALAKADLISLKAKIEALLAKIV